MKLVYHLDAAELDINLLEAIKVAFKGKKIRITVHSEPSPEQSAQHPLEEKILENAASKISYVFEPEEFDQYVEKTLHGEQPDTSKYKRLKP